jgi:hypothetical protein
MVFERNSVVLTGAGANEGDSFSRGEISPSPAAHDSGADAQAATTQGHREA